METNSNPTADDYEDDTRANTLEYILTSIITLMDIITVMQQTAGAFSTACELLKRSP